MLDVEDAHGLAWAGDLLAVNAGRERVVLADASDPRRPERLHALEPKGLRRISGLAVEGDRLYVSAYSAGTSLAAFDVTDPTDPHNLDTLDPGRYSHATEVRLRGRFAYLLSLPYLSVVEGPRSDQAPADGVAVHAKTVR